MIDKIIELSIRNRGLVIVAGLALALGGIYAVYHTPVDAIPDLSENQVIVFTDWKGHSPKEIEDQVTYPLALSLQGMAGVHTVRASSDVDFSTISVIFEDSVDFRAARKELAERLAHAQGLLPAGVAPALAPESAATGQILWYTVEGAGLDLGHLRSVQDWYVRPQLGAVPGVAEVASIGGWPIEYHVTVDPDRLRAYQVHLSDLLAAVRRGNSAVGGHVVQAANAEYVVRGVAWLGRGADGEFDPSRAIRDLEDIPVPRATAAPVRVGDVASVATGPQFRRGVLEKDGSEAVGGVVLMREGENPLEITRRLKDKIADMQAGLPHGVRIVPFYDRTPLIEGAVGTVTGTLVEAILTATVCVLLVLLHFRTSFIIAATLPLAALSSFAVMWLLRRLGIADIQTNIMSLAGLAISVGVLVDSSIVMAENAMHRLKEHFGDQPVRGDVCDVVLPACQAVGRPIFFSVLIMLLSFLPVFALGGLAGKMFQPLAVTKSLALVAVAVLSITLVPALCTVFIRGKLRGEMDSWLVKSVAQVYRPVLAYLLVRPAPLAWILGITFLLGLAPLGSRPLFLGALFVVLTVTLALVRGRWATALAALSLLILGLAADKWIRPLGHEFITPLDEGMLMDMPITIPRASVTQSADDLKARDMVLCRFPEVDMVVGKAGRAETATDPAPLDMIETMVNFRPPALWPRRGLREQDAHRQAASVLDRLVNENLVAPPADRAGMVHDSVETVLPTFDHLMREFAYQKNQDFERRLGKPLVRSTVERLMAALRSDGLLTAELAPGDITLLCERVPFTIGERLASAPTLGDTSTLAIEVTAEMRRRVMLPATGDLLPRPPMSLSRLATAAQMLLGGSPPSPVAWLNDAVVAEHQSRWTEHVRQLDAELSDRAADTFTHLIVEELITRGQDAEPHAAAAVAERRRLRSHVAVPRRAGHHHGTNAEDSARPVPTPEPRLDSLEADARHQFSRWLLLRPSSRAELGAELDRAMQMPGWTNVWTMPIQNRVDMLSTGVNTAVGIRVLGSRIDDVVRASEAVAREVKRVPGAADIVADPVRGKAYLDIQVDRHKALRRGLNPGDVTDLIEIALAGKVVTATLEGRERHVVRVCYPRFWREDAERVGRLPVPDQNGEGPRFVPLSEVADVRMVEGPASIKSENGLLRNYVRVNVRGRDTAEFVEEARRVAGQVELPAGVHLEWTGQFEHEVRARRTLMVIMPVVAALILLTLYLTYRDFADALLMMLAMPGALAGGVFFQWLFGYNFSVTIWIGYIACFGTATATGIIMLVYLREAVARAGGLENMTLDQLRDAVLKGAVQRLRPKLLTECTIVIGLAPVLWATGPGAEVIKPMAAPVLGGILVADEVIDLLLPVLFYWLRRWRWQCLHRRLPQAMAEAPAAA
jgi:Cu(I)/Ag(I) efflux system membrane protein CusA/SilA